MATVLKHLDQLSLTSAGTRQRFVTSSTVAQAVIVTALPANTGAIYIGDVTVSSTKAACVLAPGNMLIIPAVDVGGGLSDFDLNTWYFDGLTTGNKLHVGYLQKTN